MAATGETVGLAEWIIDDTCLVILIVTHVPSNQCIPTFKNQSNETNFK